MDGPAPEGSPHARAPATPASQPAISPGAGRGGAGPTTRSLPARPMDALPPPADDETKRAIMERSAAAAVVQRQIDDEVFGWGDGETSARAGTAVVQRKAAPGAGAPAAPAASGKIDPAALLPPFVLSVLIDGDVGQVADTVKKEHGDFLKAAFAVLRKRRGLPFVEELCRQAFPSKQARAFLGIDEFLEPDKAAGDRGSGRRGGAGAKAAAKYPVLPPDLVDVFTEVLAHEVADELRLRPDLVDAAYAFLRAHRDEDFIERVSDELFPGHTETPMIGNLVEQRLHGDAAERRAEYLNSPVSHADTPEVDDDRAFNGIELYIKADQRRLAAMDRMPNPHQFGPGEAGPYKLIPCTRRGFLLGYIARHKEREQSEWVIGPVSIDAFAASANMYAGAATTLLPGAPVAPTSMLDGSDKPHTPESVLRAESKGEAPWQNDGLLDKADGAGGPALVGIANGTLRIGNYAIPVKMLANRIEADVKAGKLHHLIGRSLAVQGRNDALQDTRGKISPGAQRVSKKLKEEGKTLSEMEARKTNELFERYRGRNPKKKGRALSRAEHAKVRERLDADSPVWAQYSKALDAGGDPDLYRARLTELGRSKAVSMEIVRSAGRPNAAVTGVGAFGVVVGSTFGGIALQEAYYNIVEADEGEKFHAVARELAGFAGGVLAAEGAVWIASALVPAAVAAANPFIFVGVTMLAGIAGGMLGSYGAMSVVDLLAEASLAGAMPATAFSARGGLAGVHESDKKHGQNLGAEIADRIWALDEELRKYDQSIPHARNEADLDSYRRDRVDILARRADLEEVLTAIKLGAFDDDEPVSRPFEEPEAAIPEVPSPPELPEGLACDDDCDNRID